MKDIVIRQLEIGDILYYVHKPNDEYIVDEIKLGELNMSQMIPNTIKLPIKNSNLTYYLYDRLEKISQPIPLYINTKYGLRPMRNVENKFLFAGERAAMSKMRHLNDELELASKIKTYMDNIDHVTIHDAISRRLLDTQHPYSIQNLSAIFSKIIPQLEEDGPVTATVILKSGEAIDLEDYISKAPK